MNKINKEIFDVIEGLTKSLKFDFAPGEVESTQFTGEHWKLNLEENLNGSSQLTVVLIIDQTPDWDSDDIDTARFEIFEKLESLLWVGYQEFQNNDPCSFNYDYNTDHLGDKWTFTVVCTDYLS